MSKNTELRIFADDLAKELHISDDLRLAEFAEDNAGIRLRGDYSGDVPRGVLLGTKEQFDYLRRLVRDTVLNGDWN